MYRLCLLLLILISGCAMPPPTVSATETIVAKPTQTAMRVVMTAQAVPTVVPTIAPTVTPTKILTNTPTVTPVAYPDGSINCKDSVALMYHSIVSKPEEVKHYGLTTDIKSFEKVLEFLVKNGFYFPTPEEFAEDLKTRVCRHKYAIITIDDSWNDPETMGVVQVLLSYGGDNNVDGSPKVWFGVITKKIGQFKNAEGSWIDPWEHLKMLYDQGLVCVVSHSQTHSAELVDRVNFYSSANDRVYELIAKETGPSRKDIIQRLSREPLFFIYPGGNVNQDVVSSLRVSGYSGAFTVSPGGLDGSYAYYLPRINGGMFCDNSTEDNSSCVIEQIELMQNK